MSFSSDKFATYILRKIQKLNKKARKIVRSEILDIFWGIALTNYYIKYYKKVSPPGFEPVTAVL